MTTKRFFLLLVALASTALVVAQSPEAIRESLSQNPHFAYTVAVTYPPLPLEDIAPAPEGFEPFYFTITGRHGSRFPMSENEVKTSLGIFNKAHELGILTEMGERVRARLGELLPIQEGRYHELTPLGYSQWLGIANRAYNNFAPVFEGAVEAKSSISKRCIFSMAAFNQGLKECNPHLGVEQSAKVIEQPIVRPLYGDPSMPQEAKEIISHHREHGKWRVDRPVWERSIDCSAFLAKVTTDAERFVKECGGKYAFRILRYTYKALNFSENYGEGDRALVKSLFSVEELYHVYQYQTIFWLNTGMGRGNEIVETLLSYMHPMIDDILGKAQAAIEGKNPHCANLRFTHDTYISPLLSVMGYEGCVPRHSDNFEQATTGMNHATLVPMAANLQIVLYRNKSGEVYVRSLINERDAYIPVECKTAPFYPWSDFRAYVEGQMKGLDASRERVLKSRK